MLRTSQQGDQSLNLEMVGTKNRLLVVLGEGGNYVLVNQTLLKLA